MPSTPHPRTARFVPLPFLLLLVLVAAAPVQAQGLEADMEENVEAAQEAMTQTPESQTALTPAAALRVLEEGNERFANGVALERDLVAQAKQTATGQYPFAVVLGCIDSRVPPEIVFDQGIGDLFTARVAGNYVTTDLLGSLEFATAVAGSKLVVVLGHTSCGAVKGACDNVELGNLTHTLSNIAPAVYAVTDVEGPRDSSNKDFVNAVAHENVEIAVQNVLDRSPVMRELVDEGELMVVGAMYDLTTGRVTFLDAATDDMGDPAE